MMKTLRVLLLLGSWMAVVRADSNEVTCGQRRIFHGGYIVAGEPAAEGDWPWHAGVFRRNVGYICGGTVVSINFVLTAAHCTVSRSGTLLSEDEFSVQVGLYNRTGPSIHTKIHEVIEIIRHEHFYFYDLRDDIALLRMKQDILYTDYIQPICLLQENKIDSSSSFKGYAVGWGAGDDDQLVELLHQTTLNAVDRATCLKSGQKHLEKLLSDKSSFCANHKSATVCTGDSGGGMYYKSSNFWYIRGVVKGGVRSDSRNCDPTQYATFTDVSNYVSWIQRHQKVAKTRNLLNLGDCGLDGHGRTVPEKNKPIFLQYPWTALLEYEVTGARSTSIVCNGALIHPRFVLTAGHCVETGESKYKLKSVRLGEYNLESNPDREKDLKGNLKSTFIQSIDIEKPIRHGSFNIPKYDNNIALLKLKNPADVGQPNVKPICLPALADFFEELTISGWKRVDQKSHLIRRDVATLEDPTMCEETYRKIGIKLNTDEHHVCGTFHQEQEQGECFHFMAGAPLQYLKYADRKNRYFLKGVFAFGFPGCQQNYTDVFMNINGYAEWIKNAVEQEGFKI